MYYLCMSMKAAVSRKAMAQMLHLYSLILWCTFYIWHFVVSLLPKLVPHISHSVATRTVAFSTALTVLKFVPFLHVSGVKFKG